MQKKNTTNVWYRPRPFLLLETFRHEHSHPQILVSRSRAGDRTGVEVNPTFLFPVSESQLIVFFLFTHDRKEERSLSKSVKSITHPWRNILTCLQRRRSPCCRRWVRGTVLFLTVFMNQEPEFKNPVF